ncbi:hypothetical protein HNR77_004868 [Paenibacillus sp. JGP012]|nr:hypothetical protein [Paenibacillus sp. JGP012]MBB6023766.1 hypothetical protein [Paenibacillus sp. JGP012]
MGWNGRLHGHHNPDSGLTVMYAQHLLNSQEHYVHRRLRNAVYSCL